MGLEEMRSLIQKCIIENLNAVSAEWIFNFSFLFIYFFFLVAGTKEQCMRILNTGDWGWHPQEHISSAVSGKNIVI